MEKIKNKDHPFSLCQDVWKIISIYLRLTDQINIIKAGIYIDIYEISIKNCNFLHMFDLTNKILSQKIYLNIEKLDIFLSKVNDISHLKNIKKLRINEYITEEQINKLDLISLDIRANHNIKCINIPKLKKLSLFYDQINLLNIPMITYFTLEIFENINNYVKEQTPEICMQAVKQNG